jgi:hypothetical protein
MPDAKLCLLGTLIIIAGCTTQPHQVVDDGPDLQCHAQETTGSLVSKRICTTREQRAALREEQQVQLDDVRRVVESAAGVPPRPTGGPTGQ